MADDASSSSTPDAPPSRTTGGNFRWEPPSPQELEAQMPGYTIEKLLGRGGMGAVYRGVQTNLDRPVAIKILPPGVEKEDPSFAERFRNEAKLMAKLNHPAVVAVHDFGTTTGGLLYFAMEYVDGTDVSQMIRSQTQLPPEHALAITAHVCDALAAAHELGIVHRDIKPANVLLNMKGQVKVADFGLAKVEEPGSHGLTKTGYAMGTPDYVAPEVLMLGANIDGRADLYAVGVMLYQMLTGEVPRGAFKPVTARLPGLDPRFDPIIVKAMQSDREERYQSSAELRRDLDVILTVPLVRLDDPPSAAIPAAQVAQQPAQRSAAQKPMARSAGAPTRQPEVNAGESTRAPVSPKSKAPLFLGLAAAAAVGIGAFVMFSAGEKAKQRGPLTPVSGTSVTTAPKPAQGTERTTISEPVEASEPSKANPKSLITAKAPEPPKAAPGPQPTAAVVETKPAAPTPNPASPPETVAPAMAASKPAPTPTPTAAPVSPPPVSPSPSPPVSASAPSELDQRLDALDASFQAAVERDANTAFKASMADLDKLYLGALDRAIGTASKAGKLEEALALRAEKQRVAQGEAMPSEVDESTQAKPVPATLKTLRQTYRSTAAQHAATKLQAMQPLYDKYDQALAAVQTELTQGRKLDDVLRVKNLRGEIAAARGGEGSAGTPARSQTAGGEAAKMTEADKRAESARQAEPIHAPLNPVLLAATKDKPFTNSLGMKFVPVPGTDILMCIHETRYKDYAAYDADVQGVPVPWKNRTAWGFLPTERPEDHPVMNVTWEEAHKFCDWLGKREGMTVRFPTDQEWSYAVGIGQDEDWKDGVTPELRSQEPNLDYPWGTRWPPPKNSGNYSDASRLKQFQKGTIIDNYDDGFPTTAPVMSFKANKLGIYDLGGNVAEWCEDWMNLNQDAHVTRGESWNNSNKDMIRSSHRNGGPLAFRNFSVGFRVVIETRAPAGKAPKPAATNPATPTPTLPVAPAPSPAPTAVKSDFTNSLGMSFVKISGTQVLFCVHETRYKDYAAYDAETPGVQGSWKNQNAKGFVIKDRTDDHPVLNVSWVDAQGFCAWLSKKESKTYRLPTDEEWSYAVGIGRDEKRKKDDIPATVARVQEYPWGAKWPPPKGSGNYRDESYEATFGGMTHVKGYDDGYPTTAPVMSFKPNRYGLYDMGGNVAEWCEDWFNNLQQTRVLRGGYWMHGSHDYEHLSSARDHAGPELREGKCGFRIVLETTD